MSSGQVACEIKTKKDFGTASLSSGVAVSIIDQGVVSLSNFLTSVIAARVLTPDEFGGFSLFYATLLVFSGIQNALISSPVKVFGVPNPEKHVGGYFQAQLWLQAVLGGCISLLSAGVLIISSGMPNTLIVNFSLCVFFSQFQEFARTVLATKLSVTSLLTLDLLTHGGRILLLVILALTDRLTTSTVFLGMAIPSAISAAVFLFPYRSLSPGMHLVVSRSWENWRFGKWIFVEALAYAVSSQMYLYLTAILIDARSAGALNASLSVLNLINVLLSGVMGFVMPVARHRLLHMGYEAWVGCLKKVGVLLVIAVLALWGVVAVLGEHLLRLAYSEYYAGYAYLITIIGASYIFRALNTVWVAAFRTVELPQVGFSAQFVSALVSLAVSYPLISVLGVAGAAIGFVSVQVTWTVVYCFYVSQGALSKPQVLHRIGDTHHADLRAQT